MPMLQKGEYVHSKTGNHYEVIGVAMHSETQEPIVIYRPLYESKYEYFVRPFSMFVESVEIDGIIHPRFERLNT